MACVRQRLRKNINNKGKYKYFIHQANWLLVVESAGEVVADSKLVVGTRLSAGGCCSSTNVA